MGEEEERRETSSDSSDSGEPVYRAPADTAVAAAEGQLIEARRAVGRKWGKFGTIRLRGMVEKRRRVALGKTGAPHAERLKALGEYEVGAWMLEYKVQHPRRVGREWAKVEPDNDHRRRNSGF